MKNHKLFFGILGGAAIVGVYYHYKHMQELAAANAAALAAAKKQQTETVSISVTSNQAPYFSSAFKKDFELVVPPKQPTVAVQDLAAQLTAGRYAIQPANIKPPVYL